MNQLKTGMLARLNRLIPTYSKSLFEDPKTAEKISNVTYTAPTETGEVQTSVDASTVNLASNSAVNIVPRVGRNEPCPCGSGKKYKQCHGKLA